nr:transposase [Brucella sp. 10RB9212]
MFNHHITEVRLNKISEAIIEAYKQFDLPYIWGNGESASVDGTYWDMYTNNLLAEHHIQSMAGLDTIMFLTNMLHYLGILFLVVYMKLYIFLMEFMKLRNL